MPFILGVLAVRAPRYSIWRLGPFFCRLGLFLDVDLEVRAPFIFFAG